MTDFSGFRRSPEFTGWLRAPAAEMFLKQVHERSDLALTELLGACAKSEDPRVARAFTRYTELANLEKFLQNSKKESGDDE